MSEHTGRFSFGVVAQPSEEGSYVLYISHELIVARLNARIKELERENAELRAQWERLTGEEAVQAARDVFWANGTMPAVITAARDAALGEG